MKRTFAILAALLAITVAAQTTPIRNARISGPSSVRGSFNLTEADITWPGGWAWTVPTAGTFRITEPTGLHLDITRQTGGGADVLYFPGMMQAGEFAGAGTNITSLNPSVVTSALSGANPLYIGVGGAANAANNMVMLYADTSGGMTTYNWLVYTAAQTATALGVGTTSAASFASLRVNSGATLLRLYSATAALDFPSIAATGGTQSLTITVTGAQTGDSVTLGLPVAPPAGIITEAWVSAANTVTVRVTNVTAAAIDPAVNTYRTTVIGF